MCIDGVRCLHDIIEKSSIAELSRPIQAQRLGLSRGQLLDALAGRPGARAVAAIASITGVPTQVLADAAGVTRCPRRRERRERSAYGDAVVKLIDESGRTLDDAQISSGLDRTSFYHALAGGVRPTARHIAAVSTVLGVDPAELAPLAGYDMTVHAERERVRRGVSRLRYAETLEVDPRLLFGSRKPSTPVTARKLALANGASQESANEAARRVRAEMSGESRSNIGRMITELLDRTGNSSTQLAASLGVARQALASWVDGMTSPSPEAVSKLAELSGSSVSIWEAALRDDLRTVHARRSGPGSRLRQIRRQHRLTRHSFAGLLGVSVLTLRRSESGRRDINDIDALVVLALRRTSAAGSS